MHIQNLVGSCSSSSVSFFKEYILYFIYYSWENLISLHPLLFFCRSYKVPLFHLHFPLFSLTIIILFLLFYIFSIVVPNILENSSLSFSSATAFGAYTRTINFIIAILSEIPSKASIFCFHFPLTMNPTTFFPGVVPL